MRIPTCKLLKALVCLVLISLWYITLTRYGHSHSTYDEDGSDTLEKDIQRLLVPRRPGGGGGQQLKQQQPQSVGSGSIASSNGSSSSWSYGDPLQEEKQLRDWRGSEKHLCSHNLILTPAGFARLQGGVLIDPARGVGRKGGEEILEVLNQSESSEYWTLKEGTIRLLCPEKSSGVKLSSFAGTFENPKSHLNTQYLPATSTLTDAEFSQQSLLAKEKLVGPVLAVTRYEYANLYHTMTDFYNAFVACIYYGMDPANATVLFIDGHPKGSLDPIWATLFGRVVRFGQLPGLTVSDDLVWVMMGYDAPMHHHTRPHLPLHEQFRRFFLIRHGIPVPPAAPSALSGVSVGRNCSGIRVLFVWRRDYLAHPRNPKGRVVRKVANEEELIAEARGVAPSLKLRVTSAALENMAFRDQLKLASGVQILAGMHGAALAHTLFLPEWSGLIELYPTYWSPGNIHFKAMARWRGLAYERWVNTDASNELPDYRTRVPKGVVTKLLTGVLVKMGCDLH